MKSIIIFLLGLSLTSFGLKDYRLTKRSKWLISENSSLIVNGSTNINKFTCAIFRYPKSDTLVVWADQANGILLSGAVHIEVKNFDCSNAIMTKELRKTLREDEFPFLHIRFLSLKEMPSLSGQKNRIIKGAVEIEIAGTTKRFEVAYQLNKEANNMTLTGNQAINFSDFNLQPPKKMGRLIKAKNELKVALCLKMELI